jgi:DNA-binding beta-propeller fold protein YncE
VNRRELLVAAASLALAPRALADSARPAGIALITADLESRLVVVELPGGRVRGHVPSLPFPRSIEAVGRVAVVAHSDVGAVTLLDGPTLSIRRVLRGFGEPRYTAGHPDGRHAYVTDARSGEVVALDVVRGRVVGRERVGPRARHIGIDPHGRALWIALGSKAAEVAVADISRPSRPRLVRRFRPPFLAHDVALAPDGRHAWISSGNRFELAVYDFRSGRLLARPSGEWPPQHVAFAGTRAYVTSGWSGTMYTYRIDGRRLARTVVPVGSYNVQQGRGWVLTPSLRQGTLTVADATGTLLFSERIARSSHDACII